MANIILHSTPLHMSVKLALTNSSYSNYENGYSEPPVETILKFCDILGITLNDLLEIKIVAPKTASIKTFADFLAILIDLDRRGLQIKGNTTYIPDWNKMNQQLADGLVDEDELKILYSN